MESTQKLSGRELAKEFLRYHGGDMERADAEREAAVSLLIHGIDKKMSGKAFDTLMHAVYYLRTGKYPFNRKATA